MTVQFEFVGDTAVEAKLAALPARIHLAVLRVMTKLGLQLHAAVVENLSGKVLNRRTGKLASSQNLQTVDTAAQITSSVGFNQATVPYGKPHEYGVPHSWIIEPVRAKALRFKPSGGGKFIFAKRVVHPPLKERSFLRSALKDLAPRVGPEVNAAIAAEMKL
jgi:hypothetical protein